MEKKKKKKKEPGVIFAAAPRRRVPRDVAGGLKAAASRFDGVERSGSLLPSSGANAKPRPNTPVAPGLGISPLAGTHARAGKHTHIPEAALRKQPPPQLRGSGEKQVLLCHCVNH